MLRKVQELFKIRNRRLFLTAVLASPPSQSMTVMTGSHWPAAPKGWFDVSSGRYRNKDVFTKYLAKPLNGLYRKAAGGKCCEPPFESVVTRPAGTGGEDDYARRTGDHHGY